MAFLTLRAAASLKYSSMYFSETSPAVSPSSLARFIILSSTSVKFCTNFDVLVLDEALCAIHLNVLSEEKIRSFLEHKPRGLEVILTGHEVSQDMLDLADYATMMMKVKHPYDRKVMAREGIEF